MDLLIVQTAGLGRCRALGWSGGGGRCGGAARARGSGRGVGRCEPRMRGSPAGGSWLATAYGPPWDDGNGGGITATGLNLTAGPRLLEVAVDPSVIALGSYVYVQPNPFGTSTRSTPETPAARFSAATSTSTTGKGAPANRRGAHAPSPSPQRPAAVPATCSAQSPHRPPTRATQRGCGTARSA